jgi:carbonic anhydrase
VSTGLTPDAALAALVEGNRRFVAGQPLAPHRDAARREATLVTQSPIALVLGCADSRVVPELVFDQGIGDLFVLRVAGNSAASPPVAASVEFFVGTFGVPLVVVLGHEGCGAMRAILDVVEDATAVDGRFATLAETLLPAARSVQHLPPPQRWAAAVERNARDQVEALRALDPVLGPAVAAGTLRIVGATYALGSGAVRLLED